jgi:hypothetical protein
MKGVVIEIESLAVPGGHGDVARLEEDLRMSLCHRLQAAGRDGEPIAGEEQIREIGTQAALAIARALQGRNRP